MATLNRVVITGCQCIKSVNVNTVRTISSGVHLCSPSTSPQSSQHELNQYKTSLTVKQVYKNLLHLGKDFPKGYEYFRDRCKLAFLKNKDVTDEKQVEVLLARAVYVSKELEALYMLKKYRTLKKRYYSEELK